MLGVQFQAAVTGWTGSSGLTGYAEGPEFDSRYSLAFYKFSYFAYKSNLVQHFSLSGHSDNQPIG